MSRFLIALSTLALALALGACTTPEQEDTDAKAAPLAPLHAPTTPDDKLWTKYLQQVVSRNQAGVTDGTHAYYLPANSDEPTPDDPEKRSKFDRQLENVTTVVSRTVLPGNMLVFGSPNSSRMADLVESAFSGGTDTALKGSQVLFIGAAADSPRVQAAVERTGAKYIFVEAK